jgi:hypothetical protein
MIKKILALVLLLGIFVSAAWSAGKILYADGIDTPAAGALSFGAVNATSMDFAGHITYGTDGTYDLGSVDGGTTPLRPRTIYLGTSLVTDNWTIAESTNYLRFENTNSSHLEITNSGPGPQLDLFDTGGDGMRVTVAAGSVTYGSEHTTNTIAYFGQNDAFWGMSFSMAGTAQEDGLLSRYLKSGRFVEDNTAGVGSPNVLTVNETNNFVTNSGAAALQYNTLPAAAAGVRYSFACVDADGMRVTANGDTITLDGAVSSSSGYIETTDTSATCDLIAVSSASWIVTNWQGNWSVYDGTNLNPATRLYGEMTINGNSTASGTITPGTPIEMGGTVTAGSNRGFTVTTGSGGRLTHDGIATKKLKVTVTATLSSNVNSQILSLFIAENGTAIAASEVRHKSGATGTDEIAMSTQAFVDAATDDYYEVFVEIDGGTTPTITVEDMQMSIIEVK